MYPSTHGSGWLSPPPGLRPATMARCVERMFARRDATYPRMFSAVDLQVRMAIES